MSDVTLNTASGAITLTAANSSGNKTLTLPAVSDTLVGKATTDTLTNKSIVATQLTGTIDSARLPAGSVLQVVESTITSAYQTNSTSYVHATNTSLTITTKSANSKILLICNVPLQLNVDDKGASTFRSSVDSYTSNIGQTLNVIYAPGNALSWLQMSTIQKLHSPNQAANTTITYRVYVKKVSGDSGVYYPDLWGESVEYSFTAMEIAA